MVVGDRGVVHAFEALGYIHVRCAVAATQPGACDGGLPQRFGVVMEGHAGAPVWRLVVALAGGLGCGGGGGQLAHRSRSTGLGV